MEARDAHLVAGALALAYRYCDLAALRRAFSQPVDGDDPPDPNQGEHEDGQGAQADDLPARLAAQGSLSAARAEKLRRATALAARLRGDAVYGMVAMRNRLVSGPVLNACMEEVRRTGYARTLSEVLLERGLLSETLDEALVARRDTLLPELRARELALAQAIDLQRLPDDLAELELAVLLGEVASRLSFLSRDELDQGLAAEDRAARGLPPAPPAAPARTPQASQAGPTAPMGPTGSPGSPGSGGPRPGPGGAAGGVGLYVPPPGATRAEVPTAPPGQDAIKGYELLETLGAGAMGSVCKARKRDTGEWVALKILKSELAGDREYVERFLREAKAVARLSHKNVVRAVQVGRSGEHYYFAMEFVEGQTIAELIRSKGRLPERFSLQVVRCVAAALAHAWQHRIIHRDIKPDNIMITRDGAVKLTDLGLARTVKQDSTLTMSGVVMGSPAYISPEQATGTTNLDSRSDIYALGATLFHLLTGRVPYEGDTPLHVMLRHMNDPVPDVRLVVPEVTEATKVLIQRMMAKQPGGRFANPMELEAAARLIDEALGRGETPPVPSGVRVGQSGPLPQVRQDAQPAAPGKRAPSALRASTSGERAVPGKSGERRKEAKEKAKQKEIGERLRRMSAKKRRGRF